MDLIFDFSSKIPVALKWILKVKLPKSTYNPQIDLFVKVENFKKIQKKHGPRPKPVREFEKG